MASISPYHVGVDRIRLGASTLLIWICCLVKLSELSGNLVFEGVFWGGFCGHHFKHKNISSVFVFILVTKGVPLLHNVRRHSINGVATLWAVERDISLQLVGDLCKLVFGSTVWM